MNIIKANKTHIKHIAALALKLWPDNEPVEFQEELNYIMAKEDGLSVLLRNCSKEVP